MQPPPDLLPSVPSSVAHHPASEAEHGLPGMEAQQQAAQPVAAPAPASRRALLRGAGLVAAGAAAYALTHPVQPALAADPAPPMMRGLHPQALVAAAAPDLPPLAVIAYTRMGFGPTPASWQEFKALGNTDAERLATYVEQQLAPSAIDDSGCDAILAAQNFQTLGKSLEQLWADHVRGEQDRSLPFDEVERATWLRAVYSKRQLLEVLADHWHNHFNVLGWDYWAAPVFSFYDREVIRKHALGNFRAMLEAVAKSPPMLYYLDNQSNSGEHPNENYARELFELHAMGAENYLGVRDPNDPDLFDAEHQRIGYIDADVYGATTCFTGWRVDDDTGLFTFDDARHFPYQKFVLGKIIPEFQGIKDGMDVLDMLAAHKGVARYVCRRLCRRLVSDVPPERLVQEAADVFHAQRDAPDQLKSVVRVILRSPEFAATWGEKIKRPFEYVASILRASKANYSWTDSFGWVYGATGQPLFGWRPPNGYPDDKETWSSTMPMLQRWRTCNWLIEWAIGGDGADKDNHRLNLEPQMPASVQTPEAIVDFWSQRILGHKLPAAERQPIVDFMAFGRNPTYALPADQIAERLRYMVGLIFMSPSFQWR